ncbi:MAG TPA: carboxymuconolactone decarboxylase family protein [Gemmatimonadales bacterium]|nr:carboxymuconolactone decarboxylase family protein [Gemmatimonadales bacterium]
MTDRIAYATASPDVFQAMLHMEQVVRRGGLDPALLELVKIRASQLNGCAWCLDMHTKDARARGETEQRLHLLAAWRDAPCYSARERAVLAWTEAVTLIANTHQVSDEVYAQASAELNGKELADLTLAIVAINGWNRFNVAFRTPLGDYVSPHRPT